MCVCCLKVWEVGWGVRTGMVAEANMRGILMTPDGARTHKHTQPSDL